MDFEPLSDHLIAKHERAQRLAGLMRAGGASPHSLHTTLTDLDDFLNTPSTIIPPSTHPNAPSPNLVTQYAALPLSEIPSQPLTWLWPQRIPLGKLTLLDGEPGSGTSLLALTLAASLSTGQPLPTDTTEPAPSGATTPSNVVLIAPYDHASDTLLPRPQAAGADLTHLFLLGGVPNTTATPTTSPLSRPFCLADDLDLLEATIGRLQASLVIIDPLHAVLGPSHSRSSSSSPSAPRPSTRTLLASLVQLAQRTHCAFLLVRPVRPSRSALLHPRPSGSLDQVCLARSGLLVARDIAIATGYDYERVRKMLQRMTQQGDLLSPSRGLYTTPGHPSLATPSPDLEPSPQELDVPTVASVLNGQTSLDHSLTTPHQESDPVSIPTATHEAITLNPLPSTTAPPPLPDAPRAQSTNNHNSQANDAFPSVANVPIPEDDSLASTPRYIPPYVRPDHAWNTSTW